MARHIRHQIDIDAPPGAVWAQHEIGGGLLIGSDVPWCIGFNCGLSLMS